MKVIIVNESKSKDSQQKYVKLAEEISDSVFKNAVVNTIFVTADNKQNTLSHLKEAYVDDDYDVYIYAMEKLICTTAGIEEEVGKIIELSALDIDDVLFVLPDTENVGAATREFLQG